MKFLVIRFSSIGDIVLTTAAVRCLKTQVPDAEVHFLSKKTFEPILASNPYIDKLHLLENDLDKMLEELKRENYDYVIDLHHNLRTLRVKKALGVKANSLNKLNLQKWLLTSLKINRMPPVHIVDRCMDTLKTFGVTNDGAGLDYFILPQEEIRDQDLPLPHQLSYIGIVIGAALATKQLPLEKLKELCGRIDYPIVLLGGPEDRQMGDEIAIQNPEKIYNSCGKFRLNESASLVKKAKLIISHDTGLMHIAAAFKKPILSIWGNTTPAFGMAPYYGEQYERRHGKGKMEMRFEVQGLRCRPCSKIGYRKCPKGHFKCMMQQDISAIARLAMQYVTREK
jgi:ADP-heptose:LPS heptosyltransferase